MSHGKVSVYVQRTRLHEYRRWSEMHILTRTTKLFSSQGTYLSITCLPPLTFHTKLVLSTHPKINHTKHVREISWQYLGKIVGDYISEGIEVILGLDANSDPNDKNSYVCRMITNLGLIDVIKTYNPSQVTFPTYCRGSKRIDIVIDTENISKKIVYAAIMPQGEVIASDHHSIIIDLHAQHIWNNNEKGITSPTNTSKKFTS